MPTATLTLTPPVRRDADAEALVRAMSATGAPALWERGAGGARAYLEERARAGSPGPALGLVQEAVADEAGHRVPVRVYREAAGTDLPLVVYLHGGGWVLGSVKASDAFCRRLAGAVPCVVVSVEYRLAPEDPFPAAVEDAVAATRWAASTAASWGGDADRLVLLGDSAGGNLATVAAARLCRSGGPAVARQVLAYPGTAAERVAPGGSSPHGRSWPLSDGDRAFFLDQYLAGREDLREDPDVAPLLTSDADLAGAPRTTLLLGGCDPLFAEGLAYAERLWSAGVEVDLHVYAGQVHGFLTLDPAFLPRAVDALGVVANAVRTA